jgi:hypothetical protein
VKKRPYSEFVEEMAARARAEDKPLGPEPIRSAHGTGAETILRVETPVLDELRPLNAGDTGQGLAERERRGRPFERGNTAATGRKPSLCLMGLPVGTADPRYRRAARKARSWTQRRCRELAVQSGGPLGAGPCGALANAGLALAASRVLYELAAETLSAKMFQQAAELADKAKQQELFAVGLASREAGARKPQTPEQAQAEYRRRILGVDA